MVIEIRTVIDKIKSEKGPVSLFLLMKNNPAIEDWSVMFSAPWVNGEKSENVFSYLTTLLKENLIVDDLKKISRLGILTTNNDFVAAVNSAFSVEGGSAELKNCQINSFLIEDGILFESVRVPLGEVTALKDVPAGSVVTTEDGQLYWYSKNGKRYVFPNVQTYETWYPKEQPQPKVFKVSSQELAKTAIGGNVTYKPGVRLIKIKTDPKIYAISLGGYIRWIQNENLIEQIYGKNWRDILDVMPDAFFVNYSVGKAISSPNDYNPTAENVSAKTIDTP